MKEEPVEIDIASPQYASFKENVLKPLKDEFGSCEFVESHSCKFEGQTFTHLVFDYESKRLSVLIADLGNHKALEPKYIAKLTDGGYQIARFDVERKAVFVISDLPEQKNTIAAEVLETPLRRQFSNDQRASLISFANYSYR